MVRRDSGQLGFALDGFDERRPRRAQRSLDENPDAARVNDDAGATSQDPIDQPSQSPDDVVERGHDPLQCSHEVGAQYAFTGGVERLAATAISAA